MVCVDADGRIAVVNAQVERLFGYRREELEGQLIEILVPDAVRAAHPRHRAGYGADPKVRPMGAAGMQLAGRRRDGSIFPAGISLSAIETDEGMLVTAAIRDETGRHRAEARFRGLLEAAPDGMVCVNAGGQITMVNAQVERLFGYRREELEGQSVDMLVPDAVRASHPKHRAGYAADPEVRPMGAAGMQLAGRRRDGTTFPAEISLSGTDTDEGAIFTAAVRDVTERRQQQDDLERANRNLESFAYSISHDLRAPLRALAGFSAALMEECADDLGEAGRGYAQRIQAASEQMSRLIDDLLHLSRVSRAQINLQAVDLGADVASIAEGLQHDSPDRRVRFTIQQPVWALADRSLIRTVLQNLLDNAWKFTSARDDASIEFGADLDETARLCCHVRDNGAGFDFAYVDKLFKPFQRLHTTREFPGTGVGLASVRQIVERHGGRVWAEGTVGGGATFYFTLGAAKGQ
jgi:PAS domain S-box-containing protein